MGKISCVLFFTCSISDVYPRPRWDCYYSTIDEPASSVGSASSSPGVHTCEAVVRSKSCLSNLRSLLVHCAASWGIQRKNLESPCAYWNSSIILHNTGLCYIPCIAANIC